MTDSADQINQSRVVSLLMSFPINFYKLRCTHPAVQVTLSQKLTDTHMSKLYSCLNVGSQDLFVSCTSNLINLHVIWRPHCVVLINMETVPAGLTSHRDRHPGHGIGQSRWNRVSGQCSVLTCQSLFLREILLS